MSATVQTPPRQDAATRLVRARIVVRGSVQGVGFRPYVWRLANKWALSGQVRNDGAGVRIEVRGRYDTVARFAAELETDPPPLAKIRHVDRYIERDADAASSSTAMGGFTIAPSGGGAMRTDIGADAATCAACVDDIVDPAGRRFRYPLTNCTHCGPRFSIVRSAPYDRANTAMAAFALCPACAAEYNNPADRRFHAQPNACHACGPVARLQRFDGKPVCLESLSQTDDIDAACTLIQSGELVAVKGVGGFHLACDATHDAAVSRLRRAKHRDTKPFAMMARDLEIIRRHAVVSSMEASLLGAVQAPIVLLRQRAAPGRDKARAFGARTGARASDLRPISAHVSPGLNVFGFMLPYTPLHHLLLRRMRRPIVLTSANLSDEPQCIDNNEARAKLASVCDFVLWHNRDITQRVDDSVTRVMARAPRVLRRSRGYAPAPLPLPPGFNGPGFNEQARLPAILAMGGELKNTFCMVKDGHLILSQHIGDLEDARALADYQRNLARYRQLFDFSPECVVVDRHPEYLSSKIGRAEAAKHSLPIIEAQHHHAHIAACLAENHWPLHGGKVLGVALDGLGYGDGGQLWGGEFLFADYASYERLATFKPVALPGGAMAMREPWRNTYAHLMAELGWARLKNDYGELELVRFLESKPLQTYQRMLASGRGAPLASSCGRLFDAFAAAVDICRETVGHEGEAAMRLEAMVDHAALEAEDESLAYPFTAPVLNGVGIPYIEPLAMWQAALGDLVLQTPKGVMAARFHRGLAKAIAAMVKRLADKVAGEGSDEGIDTVALSGGVFQNKVLLEQTYERLTAMGYRVLTHAALPPNDGGLAVGQALIGLTRYKSQYMKERVQPCA